MLSASAIRTTEVGAYPEDWTVSRFGDLFDVQQGKQVSARHRDGNHQRPFLRTKNVLWGQLDLCDLDHMHFSEQEQRRLALLPGDLLVCEGGDIGRTAMWRGEMDGCYYQNHLHRARPSTDRVESLFGMYWLWYAFEHTNLYAGRGNTTTIPNLSQSKLRDLPIAHPDACEQRKIAAVLNLVQRAIEQQERLVASTGELKRALLAKLFTEGLRGEPQKMTEIGLIPESWEVTPLGSVSKLGTGTTPATDHQEYYDGTIPFVKTNAIVNNRITSVDTFVSDAAVQRYGLRLYPSGTILMAMYGQGKTRGQVSILDVAATTTQNAAAIQPSVDVDADYLWQYLRSQYDRLRGTGAVGHISHLNLGYVRAFKIPLPSLPEQHEMACMLSSVDANTKNAMTHVELLGDLFRTVLHRLMTAEVRVDELELAALSGED